MERKKKFSPSARYLSFIARNLEFYKHYETNELWCREIWACFHGWVVLSSRADHVLWFLWNPQTSKMIRLPPLTNKEYDYSGCCLPSPPDDEGSILLLLTENNPAFVFCRLDVKKKRLKWTEMSYAKQLQSLSGMDDCYLEHITCCNGKVYAINSKTYNVVRIDIMVKGKEVVITLLPFLEIPHALCSCFPSRNRFCSEYPYLKGSGEELFFIVVCFKDESRVSGVNLFKLNMTSMMWDIVEDLKDDVFIINLCWCSAFYKSAAGSEIGGYVHMLDDMDQLISFHVKDRTMSIASMPSNLSDYQVLAWAMLECRLEVDYRLSKQEEKNKDTEIVLSSVKPDETEFDSPTSESRLLNVPSHILEKIMEHCVGVEYMKFRATCKRCHLAAPPIQWSNETTLRRWQMYSVVSPWLMVLEIDHGLITFIDPTYGDKYFKKTPPQLKGDFQICCSMYGWLLMHKFRSPNLCFFNPFTSNLRILPAVPCCLGSLCFSAPPTSPNCMVVGFTSEHAYIHFVSQDPSWRRYYLNYGGNDPWSFHVPTFIGRDMYVLCNNERIEAFKDMGEGRFLRGVVVNKVPRSCCDSPVEYYLTNCDQHLLLIMMGKFGESIEAFKLNYSAKEWEKVDSLGKHMIYISDASCICLEAKLPGMENKIYFPRVYHNDDTKMVFYSLETCKYHTLDDNNIQESSGVDLSETKKHCYIHAWIEPSWA